jgi:hypothetical protein
MERSKCIQIGHKSRYRGKSVSGVHPTSIEIGCVLSSRHYCPYAPALFAQKHRRDGGKDYQPLSFLLAEYPFPPVTCPEGIIAKTSLFVFRRPLAPKKVSNRGRLETPGYLSILRRFRQLAPGLSGILTQHGQRLVRGHKLCTKHELAFAIPKAQYRVSAI